MSSTVLPNPFDQEPVKGSVTGIAIMLFDESGSMKSISDTAKAGVNTYFEGLKEGGDGDRILAKLITFSARPAFHWSRLLPPMVRYHFTDLVSAWTPQALDNYRPSGGTPLYDAIGAAIAAGDLYATMHRTQKVSIIIQTDGLENVSQEFDHKTITDLIELKQSQGWMFTFLGTDLRDARGIGQRMGIDASMSYASMDTQSVMHAASRSTQTYFDQDKAPKKPA